MDQSVSIPESAPRRTSERTLRAFAHGVKRPSPVVRASYFEKYEQNLRTLELYLTKLWLQRGHR